MLILVIFYTYSWAQGIYNYWIKKKKMMKRPMTDIVFYRYEAHETSSVDQFGDVVPKLSPNPSLTLYTYNLYKETPKGYWIGLDMGIMHQIFFVGIQDGLVKQRRNDIHTQQKKKH